MPKSSSVVSRYWLTKVFVMAAAALVLAGCSTSASPSPSVTSTDSEESQAATETPGASAEPEAVTLRLDFRTTGSHGGSFLALERGYFADEGLDVEILDGEGSATTTQVVGSGGDTFGWADASVVALNVSAGVPVVMVADVLQQTPALVLSRADDPIDEPSDLEGKTVGLTFGGSAEQLLAALTTVNGLDPEGIATVNMEGSAQPVAFLSGSVDALVTSLGTALATTREAQEQGFDTNILWFADHGVNVLAHGYIVRDETLESRPELVEAFLRAAIRGWEDAAADPQAAVDAIIVNRPDADPELMRSQLDIFLTQFHTEATEACPVGWQAEEDWQAMLDFLSTYGGMEDPQPPDTYFVNDFLPEGC